MIYCSTKILSDFERNNTEMVRFYIHYNEWRFVKISLPCNVFIKRWFSKLLFFWTKMGVVMHNASNEAKWYYQDSYVEYLIWLSWHVKIRNHVRVLSLFYMKLDKNNMTSSTNYVADSCNSAYLNYLTIIVVVWMKLIMYIM